MDDPNLLVGTETWDDAAVYKLTDDLALVQTVDFFPPIVDDPYTYGQIAAANSLSDIYAMGAKPLIAMNIVGFPKDVDMNVLGLILKGGADKTTEAGAIIVGGHTIDSQEPIYGLAVTGVIKPGAQMTNSKAKAGDDLVLTKPIGTGIIATAGKGGRAPESVMKEAIEVMSTLNASASESMMAVGADSCTDITGFGLLGHLHGMLHGSKVGAKLYVNRVPIIQGTWELAKKGIVSGGFKRNQEFLEEFVSWRPGVANGAGRVLYDSETSGGLLIAVKKERTAALLDALRKAKTLASVVIGEITQDKAGRIEVHP